MLKISKKIKQPFLKIYIDILRVYQYQFCGNIAKTIMQSWKIIKLFEYLFLQRAKNLHKDTMIAFYLLSCYLLLAIIIIFSKQPKSWNLDRVDQNLKEQQTVTPRVFFSSWNKTLIASSGCCFA